MALLSVAQSVRAAIGLGRRRRATLDQFRHVPPTLRTVDPTVAAEFAAGSLNLPSGLLTFGRRDLFTVALDEPAKARDVFGFGWLIHLDAARSEMAEQQIRSSLIAWSRHPARHAAIAAEPAVMARRVLSLLAHADAGLATAAVQDFDLVMDLVANEVAALARDVKRMPMTEARIFAHIALVEFALSTGQSDAHIADCERKLMAELRRQVHRDGGHVSRNPAVVLDLALDLIPLKRLYLVSERAVPEALTETVSRLTSMLRFLQMPDRSLARFNGMGATSIADVSTVLRQQAQGAPNLSQATDSGYVRLDAGRSVLLIDTGPGNESLPGEAPFAGAVSFEFGCGAVALIVNCGAGTDKPAKPNMRATSAHSTLVLAGTSSAPLVGGRAGFVRTTLDQPDLGPMTFDASLDGYKARHGCVHHRRLTLSPDGLRLDGVDRLEATSPAPAPYEIHFHLHPSVFVQPAPDRRSIHLTAGDGSKWSFGADTIVPAIEASIYYAGASGAKAALQLVLRGATGETRQVAWCLERIHPPSTI